MNFWKYLLSGGRSIGTKKTNLWSIVLDKESTKQMLLENDIIWIEKHDSYIDEILAKIIDQSTCKSRFKIWSFLVPN